MAAELLVDHDTPAVNTSIETTEDVKDVLFHLGSILHSTTSSIISESTASCPNVPTKSSSEILSELFSAFNAEPPSIPENFPEVEPELRPSSSLSRSENSGDELSVERKKKTRRTAKKHKHKKHKHKHKKRIKREDSDDLNFNSSSGGFRTSPRPISPLTTSITEVGGDNVLGLKSQISSTGFPLSVKKEKVKSKSSTRPRPKHSKHTKGSLRSVKLKHVATDPKLSSLLGLSIKISNDLTYDQNHILEFIPNAELSSVNRNHCVGLDETNTPEPKRLACENIAPKIKIEPGTERTETPSTPTSEPCISVGQAKSTSKISIKSLKFSSVFEATVREVEKQAKAKADKYEEGELSNSDCDELMFSPISSIESDGNETGVSNNNFYHSGKKKRKKRHRSESGERSPKHHLSKCRKNSKNESERKTSDLSTSSRHLKHRDRHKNKRDNVDIAKKRCKREYFNEKHYLESRSTSKSPKHKLKKKADKNVMPLKDATHSKSFKVNSKMIASTSGRKTVEELTNFCKRLSRKEQGHDRSDMEGDEDYGSDSETEQAFHHPFQVKERPQSIIVNIRNSIQLPVKSLQEKAADQSKQLRVQFPVSSGQRHRKAEDEWVPVSPKHNKGKVQPSVPNADIKSSPAVTPVSSDATVKDIGSIVTQKLRAMRTLQENPNDVEALGAMFRANQDMLHWAEAKQNQDPTATDTPTLGAVGEAANPQTASISTTPMAVCSGRVGMGMSLLQKMGWKPGEGLGKNREGVLEPLKLEIKMDKKGLITAEDMKIPSKHPATANTRQPTAHCSTTVHNGVQLQGKHPVNKLVEFCVRKRWRGPQFELCHESGPDHRKNFLFKVLVNGTEYKPMVTSLTKKQAKTEAAAICLQALRDLN